EARVQGVLLVEKMHRGAPSVEQALKDLVEVEVDGNEGLLEALRRGHVDRLDGLEDLRERRVEVGLLGRELREPHTLDLVLREGRAIDRAEPFEREGTGHDVLAECALERLGSEG